MIDPDVAFPATEEGFRDALVRTDRLRRRRRALTAIASAGVAAAIATVIFAGVSSGTDSLVTPDTPQPSTTAKPHPTPSVAPNLSAAPSAVSTAGGAAGAPRDGTADGPAVVPGLPSQPTRNTSETEPTGDEISTPMTRSKTPNYTFSNDGTYPCKDVSGRAAAGWCLVVNGPFTAQSGRQVGLSLSLCRVGWLDGSAHFPGTLEADFVLRTDGANPSTVWRYAAQHPDRARTHTVAVNGGSCLTWQTTWSTRTNAGAPVRKGSYTLLAAVNAPNVAANGNALTQSHRFTVT